ncbi:MAG TPA: NAD-glutamate dehydrogenase, partial [Pseudomonadales bacterium]|nr:NAD-glutamate dehydrogenase [Pseudomonadales bacterium]
MNNSIASSGYTSFIERMAGVFKEKFPAETAKKLIHFTYCYYLTAPFEELMSKSLDDLCGATVCAWEYMQQRFPGAIHVRVFNPDFEQHGWQSQHTIIEVLAPDMPFIVDSVRMEINRRGLNIYFLNSAVLRVERDSSHRLTTLAPRDSANEPGLEALVHLEVSKITDADTLADIQHQIEQVLQELTVTVHDFSQMREKVVSILEALYDYQTANNAERAEAVEFLNWLMQGHFTFLASRDYRLGEQGELTMIAGSDLGALKVNPDIDLVEHRLDDPARENDLLVFSKSATQSRIHRPAWADVIAIKRFDSAGKCIGEHRLVGLYTSRVFRESCRDIPVLKRKIDEVFSRAGLSERSHDGKSLLQILEVYPREELFQTPIDELYSIVLGILHIQERRKLRLFIRPDPGGRFVSCLIFVPRDRYSTELRYKFQEILTNVFPCEATDFTTYFSESVLARVHIVLKLRQGELPQYDVQSLEDSFIEAARNWNDDLRSALIESFGEDQGATYAYLYGDAFSISYRDSFSVKTAVADIHRMATMDAKEDLAIIFHRNLEAGEHAYRFKVFHWQSALNLSDVLPVMENMGLRVLSSSPHVVHRGDKQIIWIHDFLVEIRATEILRIDDIQTVFQEAFEAIWHQECENDPFNQLVLVAGLNWREIALLRAYAKYLKQIKFSFSQNYIESTLVKHRAISQLLIALFHARLNPARIDDALALELEHKILRALDGVSVLDEDLILRRYLDIVRAILRTNFFQNDEKGASKNYISFKLDPRQIPGIPLPLPMFEIFVYSPRVEGVHLRGGKVARGGIRWSDRREDFRTEVLGLVKAQQVKNAVIVPVGAKGGFVPKQLPVSGNRDEIMSEVVSCYKTFIRGLLDLTDNIADGKVVAPKQVIRKDTDDPYLVVAADKGTATFSDIANSLSVEYQFWLGDAFASGGSQGYDHKKMGITARGAWVSVQRHFRELSIDPNIDTFTVLGIGDMSGDVFGNGMLMSDNILLVAAFDHRHIFIDPSPDPKASFEERKRLFNLPRSSWADYAKELISHGGGVFDRSLKSIPITVEMKRQFGIQQDKLTPAELISQLLRAQVDLIWNGGIGTYVKSSHETNADVGDKANDILRVNGCEVNARVLGEGGNLG